VKRPTIYPLMLLVARGQHNGFGKYEKRAQKRVLNLDPSRPDLPNNLPKVLGGLNSVITGLVHARTQAKRKRIQV
jgi:hypothetical protein